MTGSIWSSRSPAQGEAACFRDGVTHCVSFRMGLFRARRIRVPLRFLHGPVSHGPAHPHRDAGSWHGCLPLISGVPRQVPPENNALCKVTGVVMDTNGTIDVDAAALRQSAARRRRRRLSNRSRRAHALFAASVRVRSAACTKIQKRRSELCLQDHSTGFWRERASSGWVHAMRSRLTARQIWMNSLPVSIACRHCCSRSK